MTFAGQVVTGLGNGAKFLRLAWVRRELREKLGLEPFPGTLNLRVLPTARANLVAQRERFVRITDPSSPDCPGYLLRVSLRANGRVCGEVWLILPEKTIHDDVLEFIAAVRLREHMRLSDGDVVEAVLESD
jgi:riboflavin kinase